MNAYTAAVIFGCCGLQELLDMGPSVRIQEFGPLVGHRRMVSSVSYLASSSVRLLNWIQYVLPSLLRVVVIAGGAE